jgi:hypothetical protein
LGWTRIRLELGVRPPADAHLDDRAEAEQGLEVRPPVEVLEAERVAAAAELLEHGEQVVARRVGGELEHGAVRPHGRRADLHQEGAGDRHPHRVAAGEHLEADVAERVDEQGGGRLGVRGRVHRLALAPNSSS